jgi:hypothetical protein
MDHLAAPLEQLRDAASAFMRRSRSKLLHVAVDDILSSPAIDLLCSLHWLPDAHGPVIRLDQPCAADDLGWSERTAGVRAEHERIAAAYADLGIAIPRSSSPADVSPIVAFAAALDALSRALATLPHRPQGVVVLLAPGVSPGLERWTRDLDTLIGSPSLASVRWIWVNDQSTGHYGLLDRLGPARMSTIACRIDRRHRALEMTEMLDSMVGAASIGSVAPRPGVAWPAVAFPAHPTDPAVRERPGMAPPGLDAAVLVPLLQAARAVSTGNVSAAIPLQRDARDQAIKRGLVAESIQMELLLAMYAAQACFESGADPKAALDIFSSATARAREAKQPTLAAVAQLGAGTIAGLGKNGELAARSFVDAAELAGQGGVPELRVAALRAAGGLAAAAGLRERAADLFDQAERASAPEAPKPGSP